MEFAFISVALSPSWLRCSDHAHQSGACAAVFNHLAAGYFRGVLCAGRALRRCAGIIVYAGAIMVLFVFVVMMLNLGGSEIEQERQWLKPQVWIGPAILSAIMLAVIVYAILGVNDRGIDGRQSARKPWVSPCLVRTFWRLSWPRCCCWRVWLWPSTLAAKSVSARC